MSNDKETAKTLIQGIAENAGMEDPYERIAKLKADNERLRDTLADALSGWDADAGKRIRELEAEARQWQESGGQNYVRAQEAEMREEKLQAENERLRAGGCARNQRTTQYCAEAVALARENKRLRKAMQSENRTGHCTACGRRLNAVGHCLDCQRSKFAWLQQQNKPHRENVT